MSRSWLLSLLCLCAAVVVVQISLAQSGLTVNEPATRFLIQDQTIIALEVINPTADNLPVRLKVELLDPEDNTRGVVLRDAVLRPGLNKLSVPLTLTDQRVFDDEQLPWYRLRYRITPATIATTSPAAASGVISLSEIDTPDIFALQVSTAHQAHSGGRQYTHVRAIHPLNGKPVRDASVNVELKLDSDPAVTLRGSALTDANGYALVSLNIPAKLSSDEGELKVVARHGGFVRETSNDIELNDETRIMVTTDKPIYQPGQPLHVRALIFDSAKHAAANAQATLKITDPEQITVFQTELQTSRFGVANADWTIPDNTNLGNYNITVEMDDENYGDSNGYQSVKISRYDLPNFTVNVKPDRSFYLPQQNAGVEVRADYLFGQPVKRGHVRVVREEEREWNYREQKWDITAGEKFEGETDETGLFKVHIDLEKYHQDLAEEDYSRFRDLTFAAYFTDPTSNRTEQRRFDLRVTKDAIHIYIAEAGHRQARNFPMQFYVATSLADGTPVSSDVMISETVDEDADTAIPTPIKTVRTNKYGIALVTGLKPQATLNYSKSLKFTARSGSNFTGQHTESFYYTNVPVILVETDKALYRPGEVIKVSVKASEPNLNLFVDVSRDANLIESRSIALTGGATTFTLPYRPEFRDEVMISAYSRDSETSDRYDFSLGSRTILFPRDRDLKLNFHLDHAEYKPGDDATVDFHILTPEGRPASSALGVVIFDRAVEERARTDQDFSGAFGFYGSFSQWRGYDDQVGGITRKDLQRIDLSKPLPESMELVAELLLSGYSARPEFFDTESFATDHTQVFADLTASSLKPVRNILDARYLRGNVFPDNGETLRRLLFGAGLNVDELKDPWGTPYRKLFSIDKTASVLEIISAGPDKVFATKDDFSASRITRDYFRFTGEAITRAVERFHARTGDFIRDAAVLKGELRTEGIDIDSLRDPWGQPYNVSFSIVGEKFNVNVRSSGPNKQFEATDSKSDDFTLWVASIDYLIETRARIEQALSEYFEATQKLPHDDSQLQLALTPVTESRLFDPWGHRFYAVYKTTARYADRASIQTVGTFGQAAKMRTEITPVTQQITSVTLRSSGEDGKEGTADDFDVTVFSQLTGEESSRDSVSAEPARQVLFAGAKGAIKGSVTDPMGASIPGAKVNATLRDKSQEFESETDDSGRFVLRNLPAGFYSVRCDAVNFKSAVITEVPVSSSNITTLNITLEVGAVSEVVTVTSAAIENLNTTQSSVSSTVTEGRARVSIGLAPRLSTPRLREYFPETLVWQPALETDKQGRAQLKFKLADNITTWKMSVIGSTEDGEIGTAETEIRSFQPFFVDHDPPRVLTEGDQISLPVVLRNYLERPQTVDLEIKPESWFTLQGPARQRANVPAGDATRQTFALTAVASVKDGKQRVTARGEEASDAIEKPVTVHPDGEEKTQTAADVVSESSTMDLNLPSQVIPGSTEGEVKIYPSLMAHVVESIEGILERPHGCGEQTISSTYPSVLLLRRDKQLGTVSRESKKAQRYAELGYQRLLNYRSADGGFSYWGRGDSDLALTAYALRFLQEVREFVTIDDETINAARTWLLKQQSTNGSWGVDDYNSRQGVNQHHAALLTAFIARVLAMTEPSIDGTAGAKQESRKTPSPQLQRTLSYLATQINQIDEPYLIASYALAAIDTGDEPGAARATARLRELVHSEGTSTYWSLETNTPFYGWGLAGRVEITALAVQALARSAKTQPGQTRQTSDPLVRGGLLFLLKEKDRYGVWYSTQATINVLDTMMTLLATDDVGSDRKDLMTATPAEIFVNGQPAISVSLPPGNQTAGPIRADISRFLLNGANRVELRRAAGSEFASIQIVAHYYVPWSASSAIENSGKLAGETRSLRLTTTFDKNTAKINEEIVCHVSAERVGFSGYGMMLAEIGLPPGADVDRASVESAMKSSDWAIGQYDVLPDRVVVYLWPRAGGIKFDFKFRPRFGLTAKAAPSIVYDYYNPLARAVVAPAKFVVR
jgi:hypothetical protein